MSNMSYCRFQNTLKDLRDCDEHIDDELSKIEHSARVKLLRLCYQMVEAFIDEYGDLDEDAIQELPTE